MAELGRDQLVARAAGQFEGLSGLHRPAEIETLDLVAAELADEFHFLDRFGPFGSGGHIEALGHCDDRANDREAFRAPLRSALDEAAVDLDGREFERPNVAKRGVPGAEVVERDRAAERHYFLESLPRRAGVAQEDALGHLDFEPVRWQLAVREGAD